MRIVQVLCACYYARPLQCVDTGDANKIRITIGLILSERLTEILVVVPNSEFVFRRQSTRVVSRGHNHRHVLNGLIDR